MTNSLIQRKVSSAKNNNDYKTIDNTNNHIRKQEAQFTQSEDEMEPSGEEIPQDSGTIEAFDSRLKTLNPKLKNLIVRGIFAIIMVSGFILVVHLGPLAIKTLILAIQVKCFHEIISIGYVVYKSHHLPWFRTISWYFLITSNYYLYSESLIEKFTLLLRKDDF